MSTARLYALTRLAAEYHTGQWSQAYRIGCKAQRKLYLRGILSPLNQWDHKDRWPARFRRAVARNLRLYRQAFKQ